jgi:hypothetical protein
MIEYIDLAVKIILAPITGFLWILHNRQNKLTLEIAVLRAQVEANQKSIDREMVDVKASLARVLDKLDKIEEYVRKQ